MTVLFRADASNLIGTGHVMRCLTLANQLKTFDVDCVFACRSILPVLARRIEEAGHEVIMLPVARSSNAGNIPHASWLAASWQDDAKSTAVVAGDRRASWIVVDHYGLGVDWENYVAADGRRIAVIDDLADRDHSCSVLVDQNLHANPQVRYTSRVPDNCQMLLGPRYALLRPEFSGRTDNIRKFSSKAVVFLVAFSGADSAKLTGMAIQVLAEVCRPVDQVHIVAGSQNTDLADITKRCAVLGWLLHVDTDRVAEFMLASDVAIGAGGGMLWERAAMGLPTVAIAIAGNQKEQVAQADAQGLVLGCDLETLSPDRLQEMILRLRDDVELRQDISAACRAAVDGLGAMRVARRLVDPQITLRPAAERDSQYLYAWRNDERIRRVSRRAEIISQDVHAQWFAATLADPSRHLLVAEDMQGALGVVRFDTTGVSAEVSIYLVPSRLGSGQGASLLLASESWLANCNPEIRKIVAEVLPGNVASEELFRSCGYHFENEVFVKRTGKRA